MKWLQLEAVEPGTGPLTLIDIDVVGPQDARSARAIIDTGSSYSVLPTYLLEAIGVDFANAEAVEAAVGSGDATYKLGTPEVIDCLYGAHIIPVSAYASDGAEMPMLGVNDFLKHFDLTVNKSNERFSLVPSLSCHCRGS